MNATLPVLCALLVTATQAVAQSSRTSRDDKGYTTAFVIEPNTRQVLFEDNADTPVQTASMVKMMTALIVMEEIRDGRLRLDTPVTISARSSLMGGSQIYAKEGQVFPVQTLLAALMVQSANDGAVALAEKVAGSVEAFAEMMNRRGRALGLTKSTFYDSHGLPSREGRNNVMSARDLATLGVELMKHPLMREYAALPTMPFSNGTFTSGMTNPNLLLRSYEGAYGIKTGYTEGAGFSVTAGARRGDLDVVAVVTGAKASRGPLSSFEIAARLLNDAFASWVRVAPYRKDAVVGQATVVGGRPKTVPALAARDISAVVPRGSEGTVTTTFEDGAVPAPVQRGQQVGTVIVSAGGKVVARVPAVAAAAVPVRRWWQIFR